MSKITLNYSCGVCKFRKQLFITKNMDFQRLYDQYNLSWISDKLNSSKISTEIVKSSLVLTMFGSCQYDERADDEGENKQKTFEL